jgi:hypothetical protein
MTKIPKKAAFQRKQNRYRLVIINDDTFEEVATLKLTRLRVYVIFSTVFVLLTGLTIALLSFTNLRFLIPGYGKQGGLQEIRSLKMKTDSLEKNLILQQQYLDDITKVLKGDTMMGVPKDTALLELPVVENEYR